MRQCILEGKATPKGYYDVPNPYVTAPSCNVNLLEMAHYAKAQGKELIELTAEEISRFKKKK